MRLLLLILFLPFLGMAQTVPEEKGKIVYEDEVAVDHVSKDELFTRAREALTRLNKYASPSIYTADPEKGKMEAVGKIAFNKMEHKRYAVAYHLHIQVKDNQFTYRVDSLSLLHIKRHKTKEKEPEELFGDMNNSDRVAVETERQLNEMDMDVLKLIALLKKEMKNEKFKMKKSG